MFQVQTHQDSDAFGEITDLQKPSTLPTVTTVRTVRTVQPELLRRSQMSCERVKGPTNTLPTLQALMMWFKVQGSISQTLHIPSRSLFNIELRNCLKQTMTCITHSNH